MKLDFVAPLIENYIFSNAIEDVCTFCGRGCVSKFKLNEDCPLYYEILRLKEKCDDVLAFTDELSKRAKRLEPEYDKYSDVELMPERDSKYFIGSMAMHQHFYN